MGQRGFGPRGGRHTVIEIRYVPLPRPDGLKYRRSSFRAGWVDTYEILQRELARLSAYDVELGTGFTAEQLAAGGLPIQKLRPAHPGVRLQFRVNGVPYCLDGLEFVAMEDNVRAIAVGLADLRALSRYGLAQQLQQYAGWRTS